MFICQDDPLSLSWLLLLLLGNRTVAVDQVEYSSRCQERELVSGFRKPVSAARSQHPKQRLPQQTGTDARSRRVTSSLAPYPDRTPCQRRCLLGQKNMSGRPDWQHCSLLSSILVLRAKSQLRGTPTGHQNPSHLLVVPLARRDAENSSAAPAPTHGLRPPATPTLSFAATCNHRLRPPPLGNPI